MCINNAVRCEMKNVTFETVVTVATGGNYRIWHGEYLLISEDSLESGGLKSCWSRETLQGRPTCS